MNLKPNTPTEILRTMREEMPFELNNRINPYIIEAMHLYASEKVKEALQLAAERAEVIFHDGTTKQETHHKRVNVGNNHVKPNRGGIIALAVELIENIKKDN